MTRQEFIKQYCENLKKDLSETKDVEFWANQIVDCHYCPFAKGGCGDCAKTLSENLEIMSLQEKETIKKSVDILLKMCNKYENCIDCPLKELCEYAGITMKEYTERLKKQIEEV